MQPRAAFEGYNIQVHSNLDFMETFPTDPQAKGVFSYSRCPPGLYQEKKKGEEVILDLYWFSRTSHRHLNAVYHLVTAYMEQRG